MKVLIADDDLIPRRMLEATLKKWEYEVVVTRDGEEAWQVLQGEDAPKLAVLDWLMPGIDGVEVCRKVRARVDRPYIYILLLTSRDSKDDLVQGMEAGADDYLIKPFDPHELQVRLRAGQRILDLQEQFRVENLRAEEMARAERSARRALEQAQSQMVQTEKLAALGQMVAGVAHEINNPLAFISNNVAVLQRDLGALRDLINLYRETDEPVKAALPDISEQIQDLAERIDLDYTLDNLPDLLLRSRDGLKRIQEIVRGLRDFARLDESDLKEVDLNTGIESTVNIIRGQAKDKQIEIEMDLPRLPPVMCYPAKINQVVLNLIVNAIDASPVGGKVTIRTRSEGSLAQIEVADSGHGIEPSVLEHIFDPFFTTKPIGKGTGLGLSISYGIVHDHGGTIEVDSAPGQGARFTVSLPLQPPRK